MTPSWLEQAACAGMNPDPWFSDSEASISYATSVCARCPVRVRCGEYAVRERIMHGTWGGSSARERRRARMRRAA